MLEMKGLEVSSNDFGLAPMKQGGLCISKEWMA